MIINFEISRDQFLLTKFSQNRCVYFWENIINFIILFLIGIIIFKKHQEL